MTQQPCSANNLIQNIAVRRLIDDMKAAEQKARKETKHKLEEDLFEITSLTQLDQAFRVLDPLRASLSTLDPKPGAEWSPPQIVVMGNESSGVVKAPF